MLAKLLEVDEYKKTYHKYLREIVDGYLNSGKFTETIETVDAMINEYVKNDPTAFYSYDKYTTAVETIKEFGVLRAKSIEGQLDGTIPSTTTDQNSNKDKLIDGSSINLQSMGVQGGGEKEQGSQEDKNNNSSKDNSNGTVQNFKKDRRNGDNKNWKVSKESTIDIKYIYEIVCVVIVLIGAIVFVSLYKRRK